MSKTKSKNDKEIAEATPKTGLYRFEQIDDFDARRGYRRCEMPGVTLWVGDTPRADADVWRDRSGTVVVRFSSQGYRFSFAVSLSSGQPLREERLWDMQDHLSELLLLWIDEGVDDTPTTQL